MRVWMNGGFTYMPGVELGEVMKALGVGRVIASGNNKFKPGDLVVGMLGW